MTALGFPEGNPQYKATVPAPCLLASRIKKISSPLRCAILSGGNSANLIGRLRFWHLAVSLHVLPLQPFGSWKSLLFCWASIALDVSPDDSHSR